MLRICFLFSLGLACLQGSPLSSTRDALSDTRSSSWRAGTQIESFSFQWPLASDDHCIGAGCAAKGSLHNGSLHSEWEFAGMKAVTAGSFEHSVDPMTTSNACSLATTAGSDPICGASPEPAVGLLVAIGGLAVFGFIRTRRVLRS